MEGNAFFVNVPEEKDVIKLGVYFPVGSANEQGDFEKFAGISHVLEHNIFKGTMLLLDSETVPPESLSSVDVPLICRFSERSSTRSR